MIWNEWTIWNAVVVAFALTAAMGDVRWRKIPRALTTAGLLAGVGFHLYAGGFNGFALSALACLIGFAIGLTFFSLGAIGGGDVKLITALGAMLGLNRWLFAMEVAVIAAGVIALVQAWRTGRLRQTFANIAETLRWLIARGVRAHPVINVSNAAMLRAPFGVAAALGTVAAVIRP
ncbi:MAG TPA: A24 family peptidase [Terriglobales bacterium]|nr:A24 family peptidase [Terriglobales bacterium]